MSEKKPALGRGLEALFGDVSVEAPEKPKQGGKAGAAASPEKAQKVGKPAKAAQGAKAASPGSAATSATAADATAASATAVPEPTPAGAPAATPENAVMQIDIDDIKPNEMQPRQDFEQEAIEELAASIETYGVIQPVLLKKTELGYELIAGERRWRAARKAGLRKVPAIVREVTKEENALLAIIENMQRKDLNLIEEATAFRTIIGKYRMTQDSLSRAVGKSRPYIANALRVLKLPEPVIEYLREGTLTLGHANAIGALSEAGDQQKAAERIVSGGLSVRDAERICAAMADSKGDKQSKKAAPAKKRAQEIRQVEEELTSLLGMKVVIDGDLEAGNVGLRYSERDGLDEIVEFLRRAGEGRGK